jgi:hypothetical protein
VRRLARGALGASRQKLLLIWGHCPFSWHENATVRNPIYFRRGHFSPSSLANLHSRILAIFLEIDPARARPHAGAHPPRCTRRRSDRRSVPSARGPRERTSIRVVKSAISDDLSRPFPPWAARILGPALKKRKGSRSISRNILRDALDERRCRRTLLRNRPRARRGARPRSRAPSVL